MKHKPTIGTILTCLYLFALVCAILSILGCQMTSYKDSEVEFKSISFLLKRTIGRVELVDKVSIDNVNSAIDEKAVKAISEGVADRLLNK
jgi:hypothetical protein